MQDMIVIKSPMLISRIYTHIYIYIRIHGLLPWEEGLIFIKNRD